MNDFITNVLSKADYSIPDKLIIIWEYLQQELKSKSKIDVLKDLVGVDYLLANETSALYLRNPINVLIHEDNRIPSADDVAQNLCIPLTDGNFKLIVKEHLFYMLLKQEDEANFDPVAYKDLLQEVLNAF